MAEDTGNTNEDRALERRIVHDSNNILSVISGHLQLLMADQRYQAALPQELYADLTRRLGSMRTASRELAQMLQDLGGFYRAREAGISIVEANSLSDELNNYRVVHVDDDPEFRDYVANALNSESNIFPRSNGFFGHDGKRINYNLRSYGGVQEALEGINSLERVHLLLTDREMSEQDGYALLDSISLPDDKTRRKPEYEKIMNVAMLTGGITPSEAEQVKQTYGAAVLTKPINSLVLEQQIYDIINKKNG